MIRPSPPLFPSALPLITITVPTLDSLHIMATKHGSAGHVPRVDIHLQVSNWNEGGSSVFRPKQCDRDRTNRMPGFVRKPNGYQPSLPVYKCMFPTPIEPLHTLSEVSNPILSAWRTSQRPTQSQSWSQPCPVAVYTDEEYSGMWATHNAIGLIGLQLNIFLIVTWSILRSPLLLLVCLRFIFLFSLMQSQGSWGKETIFS